MGEVLSATSLPTPSEQASGKHPSLLEGLEQPAKASGTDTAKLTATATSAAVVAAAATGIAVSKSSASTASAAAMPLSAVPEAGLEAASEAAGKVDAGGSSLLVGLQEQAGDVLEGHKAEAEAKLKAVRAEAEAPGLGAEWKLGNLGVPAAARVAGAEAGLTPPSRGSLAQPEDAEGNAVLCCSGTFWVGQ